MLYQLSYLGTRPTRLAEPRSYQPRDGYDNFPLVLCGAIRYLWRVTNFGLVLSCRLWYCPLDTCMAVSPHFMLRRFLRQRPRPWLACGLAIFTTVILVDAVFGEAGYFARMRARAEYERHLARLTAIHQDNAALRQRSRRLSQDPAAIEETARKELGMLRRGEILFQIKDRRPHPEASAGARAIQRSTAQ